MDWTSTDLSVLRWAVVRRAGNVWHFGNGVSMTVLPFTSNWLQPLQTEYYQCVCWYVLSCLQEHRLCLIVPTLLVSFRHEFGWGKAQCVMHEELHGTLEHLLVDKQKTELQEELQFQLQVGVQQLQAHVGFRHNRLSLRNVMYIKLPEKKSFIFYWPKKNQWFHICTRYIVKLTDFGAATLDYTSVPWVEDLPSFHFNTDATDTSDVHQEDMFENFTAFFIDEADLPSTSHIYTIP